MVHRIVRCASHVTKAVGFRPLELFVFWALLDVRWHTEHVL
jgi:hypothetical protein